MAADRYHHGNLRAALVEAAEAELIERGVAGFSLRGCAKRAGVSHAAPAHAFGNVEGLLAALRAEAEAVLAEGIARRAADVDVAMVNGYGYPRWRGGPMFDRG